MDGDTCWIALRRDFSVASYPQSSTSTRALSPIVSQSSRSLAIVARHCANDLGSLVLEDKAGLAFSHQINMRANAVGENDGHTARHALVHRDAPRFADSGVNKGVGNRIVLRHRVVGAYPGSDTPSKYR